MEVDIPSRFAEKREGRASRSADISLVLRDSRYSGLFVVKKRRRPSEAVNSAPTSTRGRRNEGGRSRRPSFREYEKFQPSRIIEDEELEKKALKNLSDAPCERRKLNESRERALGYRAAKLSWALADGRVSPAKRSSEPSSIRGSKRRKLEDALRLAESPIYRKIAMGSPGREDRGTEPNGRTRAKREVGGLIELVMLGLIFRKMGTGVSTSTLPSSASSVERFFEVGGLAPEEFGSLVSKVSAFVKKEVQKNLENRRKSSIALSGLEVCSKKTIFSLDPLFTVFHLANVLAFFLLGSLRFRFDCGVLCLYEPLELELKRRAAISEAFVSDSFGPSPRLDFECARKLLVSECLRLEEDLPVPDENALPKVARDTFSEDFLKIVDEIRSASGLEETFRGCLEKCKHESAEAAVETSLRNDTQRKKLSDVRRELKDIEERMDFGCLERERLIEFSASFHAHQEARMNVLDFSRVGDAVKSNHFEKTLHKFLAGTSKATEGQVHNKNVENFENLNNLVKESPVIVHLSYSDKGTLLAKVLETVFAQEKASFYNRLDEDRYSLCLRAAMFVVRASFGKLMFPGEEDLLRAACEVPFSIARRSKPGSAAFEKRNYRRKVEKAFHLAKPSIFESDNLAAGYDPTIYEACLMSGADPVYFVSNRDHGSSVKAILG